MKLKNNYYLNDDLWNEIRNGWEFSDDCITGTGKNSFIIEVNDNMGNMLELHITDGLPHREDGPAETHHSYFYDEDIHEEDEGEMVEKSFWWWKGCNVKDEREYKYLRGSGDVPRRTVAETEKLFFGEVLSKDREFDDDDYYKGMTGKLREAAYLEEYEMCRDVCLNWEGPTLGIIRTSKTTALITLGEDCDDPENGETREVYVSINADGLVECE